ncbi:MAG: cytochrome c biogenesis protein CcsA [Bacteroidaceae bacterium]|nr:cytochrome c biogenesis protein CcsA [Bacteroidaceae bacterium]
MLNTPTSRTSSAARWSLWLMHLSFIAIIVGGIITYFHEKTGTIYLKMQETTHEYQEVRADQSFTPHPLPFYLKFEAFSVARHLPGRPNDYYNLLSVRDGESKDSCWITANRPLLSHGYRIIQASHDEDYRGVYLDVIYDPWGTGIAFAGMLLFMISAIYYFFAKIHFCFERSKKILISGQKIIKNTALTVLVTILVLLPITPMVEGYLQPILRTPLLHLHVGIVIVSYILLILSTWHRRLLPYATILLSIGIILGSVWGSISWGTYWSWDPKETWALITLIVYALPMHSRFLPFLRKPGVYRLYSILCLLILLTTYLGVNYLMDSKHSYV